MHYSGYWLIYLLLLVEPSNNLSDTSNSWTPLMFSRQSTPQFPSQALSKAVDNRNNYSQTLRFSLQMPALLGSYCIVIKMQINLNWVRRMSARIELNDIRAIFDRRLSLNSRSHWMGQTFLFLWWLDYRQLYRVESRSPYKVSLNR